MARGLTQRQLAERAGIADKYLSRLEVGAAGPSLHVASKLAAAVGVGLDGLLLLSVEPNPAEVATVERVRTFVRRRSRRCAGSCATHLLLIAPGPCVSWRRS